MASYRLSDELPDARTRKAPWSPLGLFLLTWLLFPVAVPFWIINWARLGHGERRLVCVLGALLAFVFPFTLVVALELNRETARIVTLLSKFAFAYFQLFGQRPLYNAYLQRGGEKASTWPLWLAAALATALQLAPLFAK